VIARPNSLDNYRMHPAAFLAPVAVFLGLITIKVACHRKRHMAAFLGSCLYLAAMLAGAAAGLFPVLLPAVGTAGQDITIALALAGPHTLQVGLVWWSFGILLAVFYFFVVYWLFRGKVPEDDAEGYGHQ
jgi:cytochrome d ubiquinol oxidase subunit II